MIKFITKKTERYELTELGTKIVIGQRGSLNITKSIDRAAIIFC